MHARRDPARIGAMHLLDQRADVTGDRPSTETSRARTPPPIPDKEAVMPRDDGRGFHNLDGLPPAAPHA